jgi:hypothetical protein
MLKSHWAMLGCLRNAEITLVEVVRQYHARGVVPLRRRLLRLCDMTADRAPWVRTVTTPELPSPLEVQHRVAQAIGGATYSWLLGNSGKTCHPRNVEFDEIHEMSFQGGRLYEDLES